MTFKTSCLEEVCSLRSDQTRLGHPRTASPGQKERSSRQARWPTTMELLSLRIPRMEESSRRMALIGHRYLCRRCSTLHRATTPLWALYPGDPSISHWMAGLGIQSTTLPQVRAHISARSRSDPAGLLPAAQWVEL